MENFITDYLGSVKEFHETMQLPVGEHPQNISRHAFARRIRLICEELSEYCNAVSSDNLVEIADALADLLYVVFGTVVEHGLPMNRIFLDVHNSNMTKEGGTKDVAGKFIKPDTYKPVDLSWLVKDTGHWFCVQCKYNWIGDSTKCPKCNAGLASILTYIPDTTADGRTETYMKSVGDRTTQG